MATSSEAGGCFNLRLKNLLGGICEVSVTPKDTIGQVKQKIHENYDIAVAAMEIVADRKKKKDNEATLADSGVTENSKCMLIVRLMNVLTEEYLQGQWYWFWQDGGFRIIIENKELNVHYFGSRSSKERYDFVRTDENFGFKGQGMDINFKPHSLKRGFIKVVGDEENSMEVFRNRVGFWIRNRTQDNLQEIRKEWPEWYCNDWETDQQGDELN